MKLFGKKKHNNSGSSFVMVIVALAFIGILAAAMIVAIGLAYRMKAMDLKNKNNFYYLEKAVDEVYAGIGSVALEDLKKAYAETLEVMVYYDPNQSAYITLDDTSANKIFRDKFMYYVTYDPAFLNTTLYSTLNSYISDPYNATSNKYGVLLDNTGNTITFKGATTAKDVSIQGLIFRRETVDGYMQTITTDIAITQPEFEVSFNGITSNMSSLYEYAILADRGIEITNGSKVVVAGNVYGAADYYNKNYPTSVCSYDTSETRYTECNGLIERSMNSGIYVTGNSSLVLQSEKVVVPGTIASFDSSSIVISSKTNKTDVWCDNVVLGGSILGTNAAKLDCIANMHVLDDLEINADGAMATIFGNYYGYNYGQTSASTYMALADSAMTTGKAHVNSSSIVVNGQNTTLDLSGLDNLVVAGRSYIETTKHTTSTTSTITDSSGATKDIVKKTYNYVANDESASKVPVVDYATGESISVKSNQLAYMPKTDGTVADYKTFLKVISAQCGGGFNFDTKLVAGNEIVTYELNGDTYRFYNFNSKQAKADYIKCYTAYVASNSSLSAYSYDVLDYPNFEVENVILPNNNVYSTGAITAVTNTVVSIVAASNNVEQLTGTGDATLYARSVQDNTDYKQIKYMLTNDDTEIVNAGGIVADIANTDNDKITPLNTYIDYSIIGTGTGQVKYVGKSMKTGYYVWISDGDVTVDSSFAINGVVRGLIICKGDVKFQAGNGTVNGVNNFEGMIIAGGKVYIDHPMNILSNPEIIKSILNEAETTDGKTDDYSDICNVFNFYSTNVTNTNSTTAKNISAIEIADIVDFQNWKRNVN